MHERVNIIVLNWNGTDDTIACLKSVRENDYENYKIILVDNGSEPESISNLINWCENNFSQIAFYEKTQAELGGKDDLEELLEKTKSSERLVFVKNNDNLGFAAGNNVALRYLLESNSEYAMLLNNDTVVDKNSISSLMTFLSSKKDYVAVIPQIRYFEPSNRIWNCGGKIMWYGNRKYFYAKKHIASVPQHGFRDITFASGCALLLKPDKTGILSERFFFGEEDMEFSLRQQKNKNKMACCYDAIIYHKVNTSVKRMKPNTLGIAYINYLSRFLNNKHYSSKPIYVVKIAVQIFYAIPMIYLKYKINPVHTIKMFNKIISESTKINKIDKAYYMKYSQKDFK